MGSGEILFDGLELKEMTVSLFLENFILKERKRCYCRTALKGNNLPTVDECF